MDFATKRNVDEVMVIGGGEIYLQALSQVQRIHLTEVQGQIEGDTYFPKLPSAEWHKISREVIPRGPKDSADTSYVILERR